VLQLGQPVGDPAHPESYIQGPGIHAKMPLIQDALYFDRMILPVDGDPEQVVISNALYGGTGATKPSDGAPQVLPVSNTPASDAQQNAADTAKKTLAAKAPGNGPVIDNVSGEPIIVDTFARYKIVDPLQFLKTLRDETSAGAQIKKILSAATRAELGRTTLQQLLSPERAHIMASIKDRVNGKITDDKLGIEIVDVRIVRADLTPELRTSTVRRMISELTERATETRGGGEERALEIRSTAEKERSILLANAKRDTDIVKGQGDKDAITIYAEAFNKDKDFYAFMRSMEAYKATLSNPDTQFILSPDSEFFKYFGGAGKSQK
jgi:modulator of FtsH protease HflC